MTRLEYIGPKVGSMNWRGADSRRYVFGNNDGDKVKFVDNRDVAMFLNMRDKRKPLFRRYKPATPKAKLSAEQKQIANPILPAREQVPASAALIKASQGVPQDADLIESRRSDGVLDVGEQVELVSALVETAAQGVLATAKAKVEAFKAGFDLSSIVGTGRGGKVTVGDVRKYAKAVGA
jgi:pyruvate/2-oxoglutarate dehydrogenase complex dihydrolipoamide acyltransferase (E2) component